MRIVILVLTMTVTGLTCAQSVQPAKSYAQHCFPGLPCWPKAQDEIDFVYDLDGEAILATDPRYIGLVIMRNLRLTKYPYVIVMAASLNDVRKSILFARKYNLMVSIRSSGHSYTGRSTHDGSLQINLQNMKKIWVNLNSTRSPGGEVTVESGNTWARVYEEVDKYGRVVVGGSAHTVAMGGYTQGGGHSPMSRSLGLAVDSLLEAKLVTSDGKIVHVTENEALVLDPDNGTVLERHNGDLFWALRGGGGGTWGVVISFTFKLHVPPPQLVHLSAGYYFYEPATGAYWGRPVIDYVFNLLPRLPREWGGYIIFSTYPSPFFMLSLLHYGKWNTTSREAILPLLDQWPVLRLWNTFTNHSSFWSYEKGVNDANYTTSYIFNTLIQKDTITPGLTDFFLEMRNVPDNESAYGCTGTLTGGKMNDADPASTAINPDFRSSLVSMSCGLGWDISFLQWDRKIQGAIDLGKKLRQHGRGVYFNEPDAVLPDWKTQFWGDKYDRLLQIKQKWDPGNFLWCPHCVGDDSTSAKNNHGEGLPFGR